MSFKHFCVLISDGHRKEVKRSLEQNNSTIQFQVKHSVQARRFSVCMIETKQKKPSNQADFCQSYSIVAAFSRPQQRRACQRCQHLCMIRAT